MRMPDTDVYKDAIDQIVDQSGSHEILSALKIPTFNIQDSEWELLACICAVFEK